MGLYLGVLGTAGAAGSTGSQGLKISCGQRVLLQPGPGLPAVR